MRTLITLSAAAMALAACAGDPASGGSHDYNAQVRQLAADCQQRGGILAPTGAQSGQAARDNVCKINGEPSGLIRH